MGVIFPDHGTPPPLLVGSLVLFWCAPLASQHESSLINYGVAAKGNVICSPFGFAFSLSALPTARVPVAATILC